MRLWLRTLLLDEQGQDLSEYALIVAFIAIVACVVFATSGSSIKNVWSTASSITSSADALFGGPGSVSTAQHGSH